MIIETEGKSQVMERLLAEGVYDWSTGESLSWTPDEQDAGENGRRMTERYRAWAGSTLVTYTPGKYQSAKRTYLDMPLETINPINDTITLPEPHYDGKLQKWVVPKNVFNRNVLGRRRFLFEIDGMALADQRVLLEPLLKERIIQRVVFSGNKSLHCVVEEADEPEESEGEEMYKWAWRWMALKYFGDTRFADYSLPMKINSAKPEVVDNRCGHPSRTTRTPFAIRKDEATGGEPVEQKLLYFRNGRSDSGWREVYSRVKAREAEENGRTRRRAAEAALRNRARGKKTPNAAALRFMGADKSDGWKHASLPGAVGSLKACGYTREEVERIFEVYGKELRVFALRVWDFFEKKERR